MSSSRGLTNVLHQHSLRLPSSIRAALFPARPQFLELRAGARFFSSSPSQKHQHGKPASTPAITSFIRSDPVLRVVAQTRQPVLIYKAPNRPWYTFGTYALASTSIAVGLWVWKWSSELPADLGLPFFVQPTHYVIGFGLLIIGTHIYTAPVRRCSSIEVIPGYKGGPMQLRVKARIAPLLTEQTVHANISDVTFDKKTAPMVEELIEAERARRADVSEGLEGMFIIRRIWNMTARLLDQKWTSFFNRFKFAVLRFGISKISVHGEKWKIDCSGYLRENGKAIDRLIAEED